MPPEIVGVKMEPERLFDSVNILLSLQVRIILLPETFLYLGTTSSKYFLSRNNPHLPLQSKNGGLAAWEPAGALEWLEVNYINVSNFNVSTLYISLSIYYFNLNECQFFSSQMLNPVEFVGDVVIDHE